MLQRCSPQQPVTEIALLTLQLYYTVLQPTQRVIVYVFLSIDSVSNSNEYQESSWEKRAAGA
jgi:hypothetical protein